MNRLIIAQHNGDLHMAVFNALDELLCYEVKQLEQKSVGEIVAGSLATVRHEIGSAFFAIGEEKNAFMNASLLQSARFEKLQRIYGEMGHKNVNTQGGRILLQVKNNGFDGKGTRVTPYIEYSDALLVWEPFGDGISISKHIKNPEERERFKEWYKNVPFGGVIVRSKAEGCSEGCLHEEFARLNAQFDAHVNAMGTVKVGHVMNGEMLRAQWITNILRTYDVEQIVTDDEVLFHAMKKDMHPVQLKAAQKKPLFKMEKLDIHLKKLLHPSVFTVNGAGIVIRETEAVVAIDVNMGTFREMKNHEANILAANKECAIEIARHIGLRHLSGSIVIDFVNMKSVEAQREITNIFTEYFKKLDGTISVGGFAHYGLFLCARQRTQLSLSTQLAGVKQT
ncbi:MAG: ribonuclease E/G [Bacilli bacterium]